MPNHHLFKDYPFMTCVLNVRSGSSWQRTVRKVLSKCHGVYSFRMDENGTVEISGTVDPESLLRSLGRAGSRAEMRWFQFGECSSNLFMPTNRDGRFLQAANPSRPNPPSHHPQLPFDPHHGGYIPYGYPYNYQQRYEQSQEVDYDGEYEYENRAHYRSGQDCCVVM